MQHDPSNGPTPDYYDPSDNDMPIYGTEVDLTLDDKAILSMDDQEQEAQALAVKAWHRANHKELDPKHLQPYLGYRPTKIIEETLKRTTQLAKMVIRYPMRRHIKSRAPHLNVFRIEETVSTDPLFSNVRSIHHGYTCAQVFFGLKSHMINVYGMKSKGSFPEAYRDFIREHGCPSALRRDNAREEQSEEILKIHRELFIKDEFTEPYNPQQNPVELKAIKYLKEHSHVLLDRTGAPESCWFLAIKYLADVHNICADPTLRNQVPITVRTGVTKDISAWLQFSFWQAVLYLDHEETWPASKERAGRWVGVTENIGDQLT